MFCKLLLKESIAYINLLPPTYATKLEKYKLRKIK